MEDHNVAVGQLLVTHEQDIQTLRLEIETLRSELERLRADLLASSIRGEVATGKVRPVLKHVSLLTNPMPSRTIEESHRPRVSDRTMLCHSSSGQSSGL